MKKLILASLLLISSAYSDYSHNRSQVFYPNQNPQKAGCILAFGEHELRGKSTDGIIELENGAQFKATSGHQKTLESWSFYDRITFCPNSYFFGRSEFFVMNLSNGESLKADIWASPTLKNTHTYRLSYIDRAYEEVVLVSNQGHKTRWKISSDDFNYLRFWNLGDAIVIGKNEEWCSWFSSDPEYILVSYSATESNLYVRATPKPL